MPARPAHRPRGVAPRVTHCSSGESASRDDRENPRRDPAVHATPCDGWPAPQAAGGSGRTVPGLDLRCAEPRDAACAAPARLEHCADHDVRSGHPLRPWRRTPAARTPHARSRRGQRRRPAAGLHPAARRAAGALLNLDEPRGVEITPWADRVQLIDAEYGGTWELPALGAVTAPTAVLIRPDGYVGWVGEDLTHAGLPDALTTWFGPPKCGVRSNRCRLVLVRLSAGCCCAGGDYSPAAIWRATMAASSPTPINSEDLRLRRKWTPTK